MTFDRETLVLLDRSREVDVETVRIDGQKRRTRIWVVVDNDQVFVRSVRGDRGHWYQSARDEPDQVTLVVGGKKIPVRAIPATDEESIARCSAALGLKYGRSGASLLSMLRPQTFETTLLLEPRATKAT